jgi:hypothetical protein
VSSSVAHYCILAQLGAALLSRYDHQPPVTLTACAGGSSRKRRRHPIRGPHQRTQVRELEGIVEGPVCHAIIETVFADLIDGPLAHMPSGRFGANSAWILCAAISHNLLRAAGVLAGDSYAVARGATLRRRIVNLPARLARPQRRSVLHLPSHWPWASAWKTLWRNTIGTAPRLRPPPTTVPA